MNGWEQNAQLWKTMPFSSSILFFGGVFCLFSSLVLIGTGMSFQSQPMLDLVGGALIGGIFAMGWAFAFTRRIFWLIPIVAISQFVTNGVLGAMIGPRHALDAQEMAHKLQLHGFVEIVLVIAGYAAFILFFNREGSRFFKTQTEVRLAGEIHRTLVPVRHETIGNIELFGTSIPSSEVGGDLFDIVQSDGSWHAYVADISGHGVASGILMSMTKSAAFMQLTKLKKPAELLTDLNDVMQPFTAPANYLTFAYVGGNGSGPLNFALGGHLPILHYQAESKTIIEHSDSNVPIGLFKNQSFKLSELSLLPGDLLAVITDGFTEVFDSKEKEIGMEEFKALLLSRAAKPLPKIYGELRAETMKFGKQTDDQTMLLIRRLG
jgi:serine phosphatase RsbU (regulator of sigma subunit)